MRISDWSSDVCSSDLLFTREFFEAQMEVVIEEKVPVYAAGLGHPGPWMDRLHSNGTRVMAVIGKVKHAQQVVDYGIDMIDRERDVWGKSGAVGVDLGGSRLIKKKKY